MAETNPFENDPKMNDLWNEIPQGMREAQQKLIQIIV